MKKSETPITVTLICWNLFESNATHTERTWVHAVWSNMVNVGLFFKFTICKTVKDLINLLKLKLKFTLLLWYLKIIKMLTTSEAFVCARDVTTTVKNGLQYKRKRLIQKN